MWIKKFMAVAGVLCLCTFLLLPAHAQAADDRTTILTTTVPDTHEVQLIVGEHRSVEVDGTEYWGTVKVSISRQSEQVYKIIPEDGWRVDTVTYGLSGLEKTVMLTDSAYTAPALNQDGNILTVMFVKTSSGGQSGNGEGNTSSSPQTGDNTNFFGYLFC